MQAQHLRFELVPDWPKQLPNNWQLGPINGVALDARGHVWICHFSGTPPEGSIMARLLADTKLDDLAPPILEFSPQGELLRAWGGPGKGYDWPRLPHGLHVDHNGFVWIGGTWKDEDAQILKFTQDGTFVLQIGSPGVSSGAQSTTGLGRPANFCVDPDTSEIFVADGYANRRIIVFDAETGAFKRMWGAYGREPVDPTTKAPDAFHQADAFDPLGAPSPYFNSPVHAIALARDGQLYVCDRSNRRIQVFRRNGDFVREFHFHQGQPSAGQATHVVFSPDELQSHLIVGMLTDENPLVVVRRDDGEVVSRSGAQLSLLHMLDIDAQGNVFTGEVGRKLRKWRPVYASNAASDFAAGQASDAGPCC